MRTRRLMGALAAMCALAATAGACGGAQQAASADKQKQERERERREMEQLRREAQARADACRGVAEELLDALGELDSRLDVGLSYAEYGDYLGDLKVAYDDAEFDEADYQCIASVGVPAERAVNQYFKAYNIWDECFGDFDCSVESVEPLMQ